MSEWIVILPPTPAVYRSLRRHLLAQRSRKRLTGAPVTRGVLGSLPRPLARRICTLTSATHHLQATHEEFERPDAQSKMQAVLSRRQVQVLEQLRLGLSNKSIASALHLSEATVKSHVRAILHALGAANRTEAIYKADRLRPDGHPANPAGSRASAAAINDHTIPRLASRRGFEPLYSP